MAFGFPYPRFRQSRIFHLGIEELNPAVGSALENLGWRYKLLWGKDFQVRIPTTHWSWHHDMMVRILPGGIVEAESKSTYQEMFFDLGRNKRNVETLFAQLDQVLARGQGGVEASP